MADADAMAEVRSWKEQHEDEAWLRFHCERAKGARTEVAFAITNESLTLAELRSLIGKCNVTPTKRFPACQVRLIKFDWDWDRCTRERRFVAFLEYSPLGWPEGNETDNSPAFIVDGTVTVLPIQPPCPYELADLNVLWAKD